MSYSDNVDLEAQIPYSDSPEFDILSEKVSSGLFDINSNIVSLENILKTEGHASEERALEVAENTRQRFKSISEPIRSLQTWPDALPSQKFTQQKLSREFSSALAEFQAVQRDLAHKERSSIIRARSTIAQEELENSGFTETESEAALAQEQESRHVSQAEIDYQRNLIEEREAEIQGIEQGIEELNEIFTDLGTIVAEQGTIIGKYGQIRLRLSTAACEQFLTYR